MDTDKKKIIRLLLVDDEAEFREATAAVLQRRGFSVIPAESGEEALETLRELAEPIDVVLLDLRMNGMTGIETLRSIRDIDESLPVIILTGHGRLHDAMSGIALDIVDFLQKPVDVEELALHIRRLLSHGRKRPLREKTIGEIMVPASSYRRVYADEPLRKVLETLRSSLQTSVEGRVTEHGHRSIAVYDRRERFVGLIRIMDVLRLVIPSYLQTSPYSSFFTGMFLAQSKLIGHHTAADVVQMTPVLDIDAPLMEALHLLLTHQIINLPIVRDGELLGVLRDKDLMIEATEALVD